MVFLDLLYEKSLIKTNYLSPLNDNYKQHFQNLMKMPAISEIK
jgi:hypothetical protein